MIEPVGAPTAVALQDDISGKVERLLAACAIPPWGLRYKGFHTCICGAISTNYDMVLPDGRLTNSLALHYVQFHRAEVPENELVKIRAYPEPISSANFSPEQINAILNERHAEIREHHR